jgi:drug/metabolite transporter (DMT)-like permease
MLNKLVVILCVLAAVAAALLAYAAANYSHGPGIAVPILGVAVVNAILAAAAWLKRRWSPWILWAGAALELFVVYYLLREALYLGNLNGLDYVVKSNVGISVALLAKITLESLLGIRIWKTS